ncbi:Smad nuclear-interacting protein 1 [Desmophyllum pertusum]|uniref:Smad nuclear-interacting protein 1 n=1 Tax=Desmophyllum pertusum TaxID=174260 RepID=A0A9X0CW45_9CNID|nr:Smad nuclear-interacting protein 1 [Desmophyllum pertusum]
MASPDRTRSRSRSPHRRRRIRDDHKERQRESRGQYSRKSRHPDTGNERLQSDRDKYYQDTSHQSTSSRERSKGRDRQHESQAEGRRHNRTDESCDSAGLAQSVDEDITGESNPQAEGPNYNLSGKLTEYSNTYKGVVIKYNEPPEARKPKTRWRFYPFKEEQAMSVMYIHRQSAYLIGRQKHIVDISVDHPSCSKQHAVLQYRLVDYVRPDGTASKKVKPYIIDLDSINGTFLNNQKIDSRRFYELKEKDVLKFGFSTREYVILTEKSQDIEEDDEPAVEDEQNTTEQNKT